MHIQAGGCILIDNIAYTIDFNSLGFTNCSTENEGGAVFIKSYKIHFSHICAYLCEAPYYNHQFARVGCETEHDLNVLSYITISSCGANNKGKAAFGACGPGYYPIEYLNSSNNLNNPSDTDSYGACYRTGSALRHRLIYFNFMNSRGYDVFNTYFFNAKPLNNQSYFLNGNVFNCSTTTIFRFLGINVIDNVRFAQLELSDSTFQSGVYDKTHTLTITNSIFDKAITGIDTSVIFTGQGIVYTNSVPFISISQEKIDQCLFPTAEFTLSDDFTLSSVFTPSSLFTSSSKFTFSSYFSKSKEFTSTAIFSPSVKFSASKFFTKSKEFTSSNIFLPTKAFSPSDPFSKSKEFTSTAIFSPSVKFSASKFFTKSKEFTSSNIFLPTKAFSPSDPFSKSKEFTSTAIFSPSQKFTKSNFFSDSFKFTPSALIAPQFTLSIIFSPSQKFTSPFTASGPFTPSFTFTPNATKYPDGIVEHRAEVSGGFFKGKASATAIGVTTSVSLAFIGVAVFLMILYLRNKQKQLKRSLSDLSDTFLNEASTSSSSSYSYSYYTYEYTYEYRTGDESYWTYPTRYNEEFASSSYSDFQPDLFSNQS